MNRKLHVSLFLFLLCCLPKMVFADAFLISDIRVDGLQRVSAGTVFSLLPVRVGDIASDKTVVEVTRALFKSGYFENIDIGREADVMVITVVERPSISSISVDGNKSIDTDVLLDGLKNAGIADGEIFRQVILEKVQLELQRQYVSQGRYSAEVNVNVVPQPRNRVAIAIDISEGSVAKIKHVNIVGNTVYDDEELLDLFESKSTGLLSFYKNDDRYAREKLSGDIERLRSYYLDRGYIHFNIESSIVTVTPIEKNVYITINVAEGDLYTVGDVELAGELVLDEEQIQPLLLVKSGQTFSRRVMTLTSDIISAQLGDQGYAFASVNPVTTVRENENIVDLTFFVDPSQRTYVRRINFSGNSKTEDEVLRREMRQMEGSWASRQRIEQSKIRLERLGYFKTVSTDTRQVPGTNDQVDVTYAVEEQPSGSISASLGFSQGSGLVLGGSLSQRNFLGTGNSVSIALNQSDYRSSYSFSYLNPYYTVDGISRGFNAFYRSTDYDESNISSFLTDAIGVGVNYGYPISDTERLNFGFGLESTDLKLGTLAPVELYDYIDAEGDRNNEVNFTGSWIQSTLNRGLLPTRGSSQKLSVKLSLPGSDSIYYKLGYSGQYFKPLGDTFTLRLRTELGYGDSITGSELPFYQRYYTGGFGSIRGYKDNTLGPRGTPQEFDPDQDGDPIGGNVLVEGGAELLFPMPFIKDERSVRTGVFFDVGNVFDTKRDGLELGELRYSVGFSLTWITAIGPLSFSLAKPLNADSEDETEVFQFSLGQTF